MRRYLVGVIPSRLPTMRENVDCEVHLTIAMISFSGRFVYRSSSSTSRAL